jgi:hypothetical protein
MRALKTIVCVVLSFGLMAASAAAYHIPAASYSGQVAGGGTISFSVSGDGSSVTNLALSGPVGRPACAVSSRQYSQPIPITNNSFDNGEVSGNFPNVQGAYGHLNIVVSDVLSSCRITNSWSAVTRADPAGSEECKTAQAQVKKWKRALSRAKKRGNEAKVKKLRKKWSWARDHRDQVC